MPGAVTGMGTATTIGAIAIGAIATIGGTTGAMDTLRVGTTDTGATMAAGLA